MEKFRIETMYAYCMIDKEDNSEGIISVRMNGEHFPLVGADLLRLSDLKKMAQEAANAKNQKVILKKFTSMEIVEELCPE